MLTHRSLVKSLTEGHRSRMTRNKSLSFVCELNQHSCSLNNLKHTHGFIPQTGSLKKKHSKLMNLKATTEVQIKSL